MIEFFVFVFIALIAMTCLAALGGVVMVVFGPVLAAIIGIIMGICQGLKKLFGKNKGVEFDRVRK